MIMLIIVVIVLVVLSLLSFLLFKLWRKKKREDQYAVLLKLFEENDKLELELGLTD
jgi:heme/copper-type cytochrome/quinol oxidase subunit 2